MSNTKVAIARDFLRHVTYDPDTGEFRNRHGTVYKMDYFRMQGRYYPMKQAALYCMTRDLDYLRGMFPGDLAPHRVVRLIDPHLPAPQRFALRNLHVVGMAPGTTLTFDGATWLESPPPADTTGDDNFNQPAPSLGGTGHYA